MFTQFKKGRHIDKERELLKCPVIVGENKEQQTIYLLPIFYQNPTKLPQLFTFFEEPNHPNVLNVYLLSPLPPNVDEVDFKIKDLTDDSRTISKSGTSSTINLDSDAPTTSGSVTTNLLSMWRKLNIFFNLFPKKPKKTDIKEEHK